MLTVAIPLKVYSNCSTRVVWTTVPDLLVRDNVVSEDVWTGYGQADRRRHGGRQAAQGLARRAGDPHQQGSTGQDAALNNGVVTISPVTGTVNYTIVLPSALFGLELEPSFFIKLGAAQTMVRPRLDQERITQAVSIDLSKIGPGSQSAEQPVQLERRQLSPAPL